MVLLADAGRLVSIETVLEGARDSRGWLVRLYGTVLTRVVGVRRPTSSMPGVPGCSCCCGRSARKRETRSSCCKGNDTAKMMAVPARYLGVAGPRVLPLARQTRVAIVSVAARKHSPIPPPKHSVVTLLSALLRVDVATTHDSSATVADSSIVAIIAVILVGEVGCA